MASITLKGVPDELLDALRKLAADERRSLNQEAIYLLERAVAAYTDEATVSRREEVAHQTDAWRKLAGRWESDRDAEDEIEDIYEARTSGRDIEL